MLGDFRAGRCWIVLLLLLCWLPARAQLFAVSNDVAVDVLSVPNLGLEMGVGERSTVALGVLASQKVMGQKVKAFAVQPEYRYWLSGRPMHHWFVGLGVLLASYDADWKAHVYKGEALGAGVTFGYVWRVSKRVNVDVHAGWGAIGYRHKEYYVGDHYEYFTKETNASGVWLLPTRAGVSAAFILK